MNIKKNDILLVFFIVVISFSLLMLFNTKKTDGTLAKVYYENELVLKIDMTTSNIKTYVVAGYNGDVIIKAGNGKIRVEDEDSPLHLCSKQGWVSSSYEPIVCLPNRVVINIESEQKIDTVVK